MFHWLAHPIPLSRYLHAFEDFYRKLGSIMGTISRPGRQSRQGTSRAILSFRGRDKDSSPRSPRTEKSTAKEDKVCLCVLLSLYFALSFSQFLCVQVLTSPVQAHSLQPMMQHARRLSHNPWLCVFVGRGQPRLEVQCSACQNWLKGGYPSVGWLWGSKHCFWCCALQSEIR